MAKAKASKEKDPERWYVYVHKETKSVSTSLTLPEEGNKEDKYTIYGPYKNSKVVDEWIRIKKETQQK